MSEFIPNARIRQIMVSHKVGQTMRPEYIPPEAQDGKSLVPHSTELTGFQRDLDPYIERTLQKFPNGADSQEIAAYLTAEALKQGPTSAGPYLRATLHELRDAIAPDYFRTIAEKSLAPTTAAHVLDALKKKYPNENSEERDLIAQAERKLPPGATADHLARTLNGMIDDLDSSQQDWLAETADILLKEANRIREADTDARLRMGTEQLKNAEHSTAPGANAGAPVFQMT